MGTLPLRLDEYSWIFYANPLHNFRIYPYLRRPFTGSLGMVAFASELNDRYLLLPNATLLKDCKKDT